MSRILFWLALAFLVLMAVRSKWRAMRTPPPQPRQPTKDLPAAEAMLCCAKCGLYYPASETVKANGLDYCSPAHVPVR
ncbi:MAG: hypothetical protein ACI83P_001420 [Janthinobacterium sp.]|jgi:uncharacterized protein